MNYSLKDFIRLILQTLHKDAMKAYMDDPGKLLGNRREEFRT